MTINTQIIPVSAFSELRQVSQLLLYRTSFCSCIRLMYTRIFQTSRKYCGNWKHKIIFTSLSLELMEVKLPTCLVITSEATVKSRCIHCATSLAPHSKEYPTAIIFETGVIKLELYQQMAEYLTAYENMMTSISPSHLF